MTRFFHFCSDEKFINSAYNQFENLFPKKNKFLIYGCPQKQTFHIKINEDYEFVNNIQKKMFRFHSIKCKKVVNIFIFDDFFLYPG
jgi:hypothetical protein